MANQPDPGQKDAPLSWLLRNRCTRSGVGRCEIGHGECVECQAADALTALWATVHRLEAEKWELYQQAMTVERLRREDAASRLDEQIQHAEVLKWHRAKTNMLEAQLTALSSATAEHFCIRCHHRWEGTALVLARYEYCGDCHRAAIATAEQQRLELDNHHNAEACPYCNPKRAEQRRQDFEAGWNEGQEWADEYSASPEADVMLARKAASVAYLASEGEQ